MPPASLIRLSPQHLHQRNEGWFPSYKSTSRPCAINPHLNLAAASESSNLHSQPVGSRYGDHPPRPHTNESQLALKATSHLLATLRSLLALCSWAHSLPCDAGSQLQPPQKKPNRSSRVAGSSSPPQLGALVLLPSDNPTNRPRPGVRRQPLPA